MKLHPVILGMPGDFSGSVILFSHQESLRKWPYAQVHWVAATSGTFGIASLAHKKQEAAAVKNHLCICIANSKYINEGN